MAESDKDQANIEIPGGWKIRIIGHDIIIIALGFAFIYVAYSIHLQNQMEHDLIAKELRINTYILSIPEAERPRLIPPQEVFERMEMYQEYYKQQSKNKGRKPID